MRICYLIKGQMKCEKASYAFFIFCLFLTTMQIPGRVSLSQVLVVTQMEVGEIVCLRIPPFEAFSQINRQLFPGPLEKCRLKKAVFLMKMFPGNVFLFYFNFLFKYH